MVKEKRILIYFIGWLLLGFVVCFIGINKIFAATYTPNEYYAELYDNLGPTLSKVNSYTEEINGVIDYYYGFLDLTANSSGGAWVISSPIPIIDGHTYSMTINTYTPGCGTTILSTYNRIGLGSTINWAKTSYQENTLANELYSKFVNNTYLQYVFKAETSASYIAIPFATTLSCNNGTVHLKQVIIDDLGAGGVSESIINSSLTNQTNELNNSIQNSTNTITGAITDTQETLEGSIQSSQDSINSNIDDMEESINGTLNDSLNNCRPSINLFDKNNANYLTGYILNDSGTKILDTTGGYTQGFTMVEPNETYTISGFSSSKTKRIYYYDENKIFISRSGSYTNIITITTPENAKYIQIQSGNDENFSKVQIQIGSTSTPYEPFGENICQSKIDETNDKLDNLTGAITDSSSPNTGALENSAGWLPAGPLDSILNLPLTMLNSLTNSLGKTCSPLTLTLPYVNKQIQIPCLSAIFSQITGVNGLWTWVGTIASVLILYNYLLNLYAWVDRVLTLRAEFDEAMGADMANWGRL